MSAIDAGEVIDQDAVNGLLMSVQDAMPVLERGEATALLAIVDQAVVKIVHCQAEIDAALGEIQHSRRALSGYDHIKTHDTQQRLFRRA
jgi:hypothetical protein